MKTTKNFVSIALLISVSILTLTACAANPKKPSASGDTKTLTLDTRGERIKAIDASSAFKVTVTSGSRASAVARVPERYADKVILELHDGTLKVGVSGGVSIGQGDELSVDVVCQSLESIEASSASTVTINSDFRVNEFDVDASSAATINGTGTIKCTDDSEIECSSASNVKLNVIVNGTMDVRCSSTSTVTLTGSADRLNVKASSAAKAKCLDLNVKFVDVTTSGAASATVKASEKVSGQASGGSTISYEAPEYGSDVKKDVSSSVKKR